MKQIRSFIKRYSAGITGYVAGIVVYGLGLILYAVNPYYQNFILRNQVDIAFFSDSIKPFFQAFFTIVGWHTWDALIHVFILYLLIGFVDIFFSEQIDLSRNKPYIIIKGVISISKQLPAFFRRLGKGTSASIHLTYEEKISFLFFLVKLFYLPIMLNFMFYNFTIVSQDVYGLVSNELTLSQTTKYCYLILFNSMFLIDTIYFVFGYTFEAAFLKNEVRSVEPTFLGWAVALACYPPFNQLTGYYFPWGASDYVDFGNYYMTVVMLVIVLCLIFIYLWATISLGTRCSNLTNRGIVSWGAYALVRHPAYAAKNLSWLVLALPAIGFHMGTIPVNLPFTDSDLAVPILLANWNILISVFGWMFIYFLRAITEERHLMKDPDYRAYCTKVRYRFIPGIF